MPTYEYRCEQCENRVEVFARMSDPAPETCDACGAQGSLVKLLFAPAIHYKGSGFYATDYAGSKASAKAGTEASSSSSESSASGSDASSKTSTSSDSTSSSSASPSTSSSD